MRLFHIKFALPLVLILVLGVVTLGISLDDDADMMALQGQAQSLSVNLCQHVNDTVQPLVPRSRRDARAISRASASVSDLTCVLRC
jgi:hypothetical protein